MEVLLPGAVLRVSDYNAMADLSFVASENNFWSKAGVFSKYSLSFMSLLVLHSSGDLSGRSAQATSASFFENFMIFLWTVQHFEHGASLVLHDGLNRRFNIARRCSECCRKRVTLGIALEADHDLLDDRNAVVLKVHHRFEPIHNRFEVFRRFPPNRL